MIYKGNTWQLNNGATSTGDTTLKAASTGHIHYVTKIVVTVYDLTTGTIALTDGTTPFFEWAVKDGNGSHFEVTFPGDLAFSWGSGKAIILTIGTGNLNCKVVMTGFTT
jgi:hypothetical protein